MTKAEFDALDPVTQGEVEDAMAIGLLPPLEPDRVVRRKPKRNRGRVALQKASRKRNRGQR